MPPNHCRNPKDSSKSVLVLSWRLVKLCSRLEKKISETHKLPKSIQRLLEKEWVQLTKVAYYLFFYTHSLMRTEKDGKKLSRLRMNGMSFLFFVPFSWKKNANFGLKLGLNIYQDWAKTNIFQDKFELLEFFTCKF